MDKDREKSQKIKHFNMVLPQNLYERIKKEADKRGETTTEQLRKYIRLGMMMDEAINQGKIFIQQEDGKKTELIII